MYRTDKQFMKNPATASSRIYIGNLTENVKPEDLDQKFSQYGRILGLVVQRGFGFIQYELDEQAHAAIANEHSAFFMGKKLNVKQAIDNANKNKSGGANQHNRNQQNSQMGNKNQFNMHPQTMVNQQQNHNMNQNQAQNINQMHNFSNQGNQQQGNNFPDTFQMNQNTMQNKSSANVNQNKGDIAMVEQQSMNKAPQPPSIKPLTSPHKLNENQNKPMNMGMSMTDDHNKRKRNRNRGGGLGMNRNDFHGDHGDYMDEMDTMYYDGPYGNMAPGGPMGPAPRMGSDMGHAPNLGSGRGMASDRYHGVPPEKPERNDCEIIVVSKALTEYAEYIEHRLKDLGLIVDLLFPNDDVPIGRVLANISSRGCLYAILIMPQNEDYRSLTLNVLHGIPEEHRNMPIDDALLLITRNFDAYMRGEKLIMDKDKMSVHSKHPEHVQIIVNLLAENRQVASHYYDKLITYLQEKRDLQYKYEIAEGLDSGLEPETKNKQAELQNRIMNILNKKMDETSQPESETTPKEEPALLADPSVQKALDSLILGDMFKNLVQQ